MCRFFCAYGTSQLDPEAIGIPGFEITFALLAATFYNRLLIGLVIGFAGSISILKGKMQNAALRGAILGGVVSIGMGFYGGMEIIVLFGIVYGIITDVAATRFAGE